MGHKALEHFLLINNTIWGKFTDKTGIKLQQSLKILFSTDVIEGVLDLGLKNEHLLKLLHNRQQCYSAVHLGKNSIELPCFVLSSALHQKEICERELQRARITITVHDWF